MLMNRKVYSAQIKAHFVFDAIILSLLLKHFWIKSIIIEMDVQD